MRPTENPKFYVFHAQGYDPAETIEEALEKAKPWLATGGYAQIMSREYWIEETDRLDDNLESIHNLLCELAEHNLLLASVEDPDLKSQLKELEREKFNQILRKVRER